MSGEVSVAVGVDPDTTSFDSSQSSTRQGPSSSPTGSVRSLHTNWRLEDAVIGTSRTHGHTHQARVYVAGYSTRV